ncbi:transcription termination/antitermination factor NusG [Candidatus Liberibacter africanus]|uniref:Transcription termination/antitermination protein NusG n=2 Tax=Liberibacter africanus TaxID=34020 RepID=A0A0G3I3M2_LIBAF|nr:transcription termination/antitermination protein NusG [Candidatus Liberibacter africanus]AKK20449.1 transcription antitermination protein NusG [Candidatus Liberibacter africanus PTSAPSY]QTP64169.1 transcription termination/antitermination factor NusG [Candidatus Liberibacter africanus]
MTACWYIIQVYSNCEKKTVELIRGRLNRSGLDHLVEEITVPSEKVVCVRKGRKVNSERRFFPGYVLIKAVMTDKVYHAIKDTPKVMGFLGSGKNPAPVADSEIGRIMNQIEEAVQKPASSVVFEIGEQVCVSDGPFASFNGIVKDVDEERSRLKVEVSIFGRATPVELAYNQVEKVV